MRHLTQSLWPADTSRPVLDISVGQLLQQAAAEAPDELALESVAPEREARTWTYGELLEDAEHAAAWLLDRFRPGEHVAVWAPNVPEWVVLLYVAALSGLVLVPVTISQRSADLVYALHIYNAAGSYTVNDY